MLGIVLGLGRFKDSNLLKEEASRLLYEAARSTWDGRIGAGSIFSPVSDFSALRALNVPRGENAVLGTNSDGIGSKSEIAERLGKFDTLGFDLMAMVCDDAVMRGAEPIAITNVIDVEKVDIEMVAQLAMGLSLAAKKANVAVINGEIAELGDRAKGYGNGINWSASCIWFADRNRLISGKEVHVGQAVIALRENGFRSNGLSLARDIIGREYGREWHVKNEGLAKAMLMPSQIYTPLIVGLTGGFGGKEQVNITAMANITGGGIPTKLGRALKASGLGANLHGLFEPAETMKFVQHLGSISDREAYSTWNMGNGFMIVTAEPEKILDLSRKYGIEAAVVGSIVPKAGVELESYRGSTIHFLQ